MEDRDIFEKHVLVTEVAVHTWNLCVMCDNSLQKKGKGGGRERERERERDNTKNNKRMKPDLDRERGIVKVTKNHKERIMKSAS